MAVKAGTDACAHALAAILSRLGATQTIANLETAMTVWPLDTGPVPLTINGGAPTCYICCPSVAYLDYAQDELRHFASRPILHATLTGLLRLAGPLLRGAGLDRQVQPNNWLLATNPMPPLTLPALRAATEALVAAYPAHAIVWRSINDRSDAGLLRMFAEAGYALLPARQIYLFDCRTQPPRRGRDEKRDAECLAASGYRHVDPDAIRPDDFPRIETLYRRLYLDKYTALNPQYRAPFLAALHEAGLVAFYGLRNEAGILDGIIGFFDAGAVMTAPIVGYDTGLPAQTGLYRQLMAIALRRARAEGRLFNMSAGAAGFKRNRGALPAIEYTAVHTRHLGRRARFHSALVRGILGTIGVPLLQRFEL